MVVATAGEQAEEKNWPGSYSEGAELAVLLAPRIVASPGGIDGMCRWHLSRRPPPVDDQAMQ